MPGILVYFLKLSCSLGLVWLFYRLVLYNLTFYTLNRWYLLGYTLLSFGMPLIDIGPIRGEDPARQPVIIQYIPVIDQPARSVFPTATHTTATNPWDYLLLVLALGSCYLLIRFAVRWYSLRAIRRKALLIRDGSIRIFRVAHPIAPFSFGNAIYVNPDQHSQNEWEEIILHEYVHIRQRHTLDVLFGELLVIVGWYNPFAWLIRHSIRQNLEFIADRAVIDKGFDKKGYQYHLLKVVGQNRYKLATNFNFSSLKKRIVMMNTLRSARLHLIRFLFILPLLAVLLVAFRDRLPALQSAKPLFVNAAGIVISLPDRKRMPGVTVIEKTTGLSTTTDARGYYKLCIPVRTDSVHVRIEYSKPGYEGSSFERSWPMLKQNTGLCEVGLMNFSSVPPKGMFIDFPNYLNNLRADPGYEDAVNNLQQVLQANDEMNDFLARQKAHAEIALWYVTEDKQKRLLVHTDGTVERYGYPGTPPLTQMNAEYGGLPDFMTRIDHPVNSGYLSRWAAISAQAEKEFHTTASGVRSIIFPGDSRVIAVPVSGKPRVYDMDNARSNERPAFEQLYGKLPACVPAPSGNPPPPIIIPAPVDTVPHGRATLKQAPIVMTAALSRDLHPLYVIDGQIVASDALATLNPNTILSINVLKPKAAKAIYGEKGRDGVIAITLKTALPQVHMETRDSIANQLSVTADTIVTPQGKIYRPK